MTQNQIKITPAVTVHALLEAYPQLEDVLIAMAPPFKKLKNPILRRSVAKVATIKHISSVGGIPLEELISKLRVAVGQAESTETYSDHNYFTEQPDWFEPDKIVLSVDEGKVDNKDGMTLNTILKGAMGVNAGEIIELVTTFLPAPGIDIMKSKGYQVWSCREGDGIIKSYFLKTNT